jgi:hypothetical protein
VKSLYKNIQINLYTPTKTITYLLYMNKGIRILFHKEETAAELYKILKRIFGKNIENQFGDIFSTFDGKKK